MPVMLSGITEGGLRTTLLWERAEGGPPPPPPRNPSRPMAGPVSILLNPLFWNLLPPLPRPQPNLLLS